MSDNSKTTATTNSSNNANTTASINNTTTTTNISTISTTNSNNSSNNSSSGITTTESSKLIPKPTNSNNNNNTATKNTSTANTFSNIKIAVAPQLSLFDQLKNSANLNNIKCSSISANFNINKLKTPKNLTDWRRFADDDSSNHSATSSSSGSSICSSSNSSTSGASSVGIGGHISLSEKSIKDSFQEKFVASVLGNSNGTLKPTTKKDLPQVAVKVSNATTNNNNKSISNMNGKEVDATVATKDYPVADKQELEACSNILDLTLQPARRSINLRAPTITAKSSIQVEGETKATKLTPADVISNTTAATASLCNNSEDKTNSNTSINSSNSSSSSGCNVAAAIVDSKLASTAANASNAVNQQARVERESVNKNVNINSNVNGKGNGKDKNNSQSPSGANCVSTILTAASQQQQPQQQIKFSMPTLPPRSANADTSKPFIDGKNNNSNNSTATATGSVGIVRGTKRAAAANAVASASTTAKAAAAPPLSPEPVVVATSTLNNFTTPAAVAPMSTHYFAQCKRQKQAMSTMLAMTPPLPNNSSHFPTSLLSEQQRKQYMENLKALLDSDKLGSVYAHHQSGQSDLKSVVYSALTSALCGRNSATITAASKLLAAANQAKKKRKKKRCTDRCDSSESSDSGVVISLSSTDSSTASSEDASEPGSPFSQHSIIGDEQQSNSPAKARRSGSDIHRTMPPQTTILPAANTNPSSGQATTNGSSIASTSGTNVHAFTVTGTSSNNSNNTAKLKQTQQQQQKNNSTANARNALPTLQWPWNTTPNSSLTQSTNSSGSVQCNKKRSAVSVTTSTDNSSGKKPRNAGVDIAANCSSAGSASSASGASAAKRLKSAALEESQTKITGYFKSQMKSQIHQNNINKRNMESMLIASCSSTGTGISTTSLTMSAPATTASLNKYFNILEQLKENNNHNNASRNGNSNNVMLKPSLVSSSSSINNGIVAAPPPAPTSMTSTPSTSVTSSSGSGGMIALTTSAAMPTMPVPALKKIERSKPTKIAQVAPNLRKTPSASGSFGGATGKSPAKKHVAIAPRTPEMKQQQLQQQQQQAAAKAEAAAAKQAGTSAAQQPQTSTQVAANQPAVLLTAIRLPTQTTGTSTTATPTQLKQAMSPPKLAPVATATATTSTATSAPGQTLYQLPAVQLPNLVQLPQLLAATNGANIMQLNNVATAAKNANSTAAAAAAAASSAQAAQAAAAQYFLNGTVFKLQQFTTATTTTATSAVAAASAAATANPFNLMTAADLQEILIKQQHQLQQQQHLQLQQQQKAAAVAAAAAASATAQATNTSFQEIFQQQIAAAIAANQQQQQQQQYQQLQRLGAAAAQPVFMATPAGLLLNAASLPAMLAQAAAALAVNNSQQQQQQKQIHMQQPQQLPALQPIQPNALPALSSIFAGAAQQQHQSHSTHDQHTDFQQQQQQLLAFLQQQHQHQQPQFITATQPPPLSAVNVASTSNATSAGTLTPLPVNANTTVTPANGGNTAKLAIVKASTASTAPQPFTALNSQPPPLVTISHGKTRATPIAPAIGVSAPVNVGTSTNKPAALAKPYQKRMPKVAPAPVPVAPAHSKPMLANVKAKISAGCKIIASPTTPPPLVPALSSSSSSCGTVASSPTSRTATITKQLLPVSGLPTPALISIAPVPAVNTTITTAASGISGTNAVVSSATKLSTLPPLAPKVTAMSTAITTTAALLTQPATKSIIASTTVTSTTTTTSTSDLFDLVKNSNDGITIAAPLVSSGSINSSSNASSINTFNKCTSLLPSFCNPSMLTYSSASSPSLCSTVNTISSDSFCSKIKEEPLDEIAAAPSANTSDSGIKLESFNASSHSQMLPADIKVELMEDTTKMYPPNGSATSNCIANSITQTNEYSSYSFSSHSYSVSSAADLSLEASTPPSLSSLSASCSSAPSPSPSSSVGASPRNSPPPLPPTQLCESNSASLSSESSASCVTAATGRDMLSEMVTSSCISSNLTSDMSNSADGTVTHDKSLTTTLEDVEKDANVDEEIIEKRDLPTPESGIGGSLTASESSESIVSSISSNSSKAEVIANIINSIDSNSPPPTPLSTISTGSADNASHSIGCLRSTSSDNNSINSNAPSPASQPTSFSAGLSSGVCLSDVTTSSTSNNAVLIATSLPTSIDNSNSNSCTSSSSSSASSSAGEPQSTSSGSNCFTSTPTLIDTKLAESTSELLPKCAISPILSQPKTIRFPAETGGFRYGPKGAKRHDGVCYWDKCNKKHDSCSKLLDHMQTQHVNTQTGPFSCLWVGCKVYNKESCSRRWLERHVLSHGGSKQFKCIVEGCGLRFGSQLALQKHVNNHFTATENKESSNKRTSDPPVPKQLRKNGKKLRYRRQPFSARMFDFFDAGIMEGLQHRLRQISLLSDGCNTITFQGQCMMRRKTLQGTYESFIRWSPREIISDEWVPVCDGTYTKTVNIKRMRAAEKIKVESLLMSAYKLPYSSTLFDDIDDEEDDDEEESSDDGNDDDENNDEEEEAEVATLVETVRSSQQQSVIAISRMQLQHRRKHLRKPMKRMQIEKPLNV